VNQDAVNGKSQGSLASLALGCAVLTALLLVAGVGFGYYGSQRSGEAGVLAAVIAGGVCWLAGCLALGVSFAGQRLNWGAQSVLASMGVRLGLPMVAGIVLQRLFPALAEASVFGMILGNYLIMLVAETLLSLKFVSTSSKPMTKAV
jgi:hypothetical protein